jgi:Protein of unknown function (DUF2934)
MAQPTEEQIRKRAFELWEQAGKPEGREDEFWNQAQRELQDAEGRGDQARTATVECTKGGQLLRISYDQVKQLYLKDPFYLLQLVSERLFHNLSLASQHPVQPD